MNNDFEQMYILAQNVELAHFRIAQTRQELLDHQMLEKWLLLIEAADVLNATQKRLAQIILAEPPLTTRRSPPGSLAEENS